jgi:hypothetical protein
VQDKYVVTKSAGEPRNVLLPPNRNVLLARDQEVLIRGNIPKKFIEVE